MVLAGIWFGLFCWWMSSGLVKSVILAGVMTLLVFAVFYVMIYVGVVFFEAGEGKKGV